MVEALLISTIKKLPWHFAPLLMIYYHSTYHTSLKSDLQDIFREKNDHHPSLQYVFGMWRSSSVHCDVCRGCVKHCVWDILHRSTRMQRSHNWRTCTLTVHAGQYKCTGSSDPQRLIGFFSCKSLNKLFGVGAKTEVVCRSNTHTQNHWRGAGLWHISHPPAKRICGSRRV